MTERTPNELLGLGWSCEPTSPEKHLINCEGSCDRNINIPPYGMREISTFVPGVKDMLERQHLRLTKPALHEVCITSEVADFGPRESAHLGAMICR